MLELYAVKALSAFILPPGANLALAVLAVLAAWHGWRRAGAALAGLSLITLCLFSLPVTANRLMHLVEPAHALRPGSLARHPPGALVVLAGGRWRDAPEYGGHDTVNAVTLTRLRYAARLYRRVHLPVLVTGGRVLDPTGTPEAVAMREVLERDFSVPVRWVEARSHTTEENAIFSASILRAAGVRRILLVTTAAHMARASEAFRKLGFEVVAAPTDFRGRWPRRLTMGDWLPAASALEASAAALHELIGSAWYWMRYWYWQPGAGQRAG